MDALTELVKALPPDLAIIVSGLTITWFMSLMGYREMRKSSPADHPLRKLLLWMIGLCPFGVIVAILAYYATRLGSWLASLI